MSALGIQPTRLTQLDLQVRSPDETTSRVNGHVLASHVDEAAAAWRRRARLLDGPHVRLRHLARFDERLFAHLAGIRIAGEDGWRAVRSAQGDGDEGAVAVLAWVAFADGDAGRMQAALPVMLADATFTRASVRAMGSLAPARLVESMRALADSSLPAHRALALAVQVFQRRDHGTMLRNALDDADAGLRAEALRATGLLGRADLVPALIDTLRHDSSGSCRQAAAESLLVLGTQEQVSQVVDAWLGDVNAGRIGRQGLVSCVRASAPEQARSRIRQWAASSRHRREALVGAAALGDPAAIPWMIQQMSDPEVARLALEGFATITGVDLELRMFKAAGAGEMQEMPCHPEDEDLPVPDVAGCQAWWRAHAHRFEAGQRYLAGLPMSSRSDCLAVLRDGTQRQRRAAALELSRLQPGLPLFQVEALAIRQRRELGP
ncbi:TIGR02270 family protein [Roseateles terrae]|uniref:Uncharacterized protein (TIGR02270 family) n=1 Tax=Roseateles terrae TaxID=431060 RepID=A0ABR6GXG7_9BURK|nr:TIGR02270 family protein [Roseateles terrae]MBB3196750.1 uncharacterized protein (TIGR02270 family) [Roseateles terrae]OWQ84985.1 hypothetical protein CDN98_18250 [Roseateles terrae]